MPEHLWSLPCEKVITDEATNTVSYITSIEGYIFSEGPGAFPNVFIGTVWKREEENEQATIRVRVVSPKGDVLQTKERSIEFDGFERYRVNLQIGGFDVEEPGDYKILVQHQVEGEWIEDSSFPITVKMKPKEEEVTEAEG